MTFYLPNPELRPVGLEFEEFLDSIRLERDRDEPPEHRRSHERGAGSDGVEENGPSSTR